MNFDNVPVEDFKNFPDDRVTQPGLRIQACALGIEVRRVFPGRCCRIAPGGHGFPGPADGVVEKAEFDMDGVSKHFIKKMTEAAGIDTAGMVKIFSEFGVESNVQMGLRELDRPGVAQNMLQSGLNYRTCFNQCGPLRVQVPERGDPGGGRSGIGFGERGLIRRGAFRGRVYFFFSAGASTFNSALRA